MILPPWFAVRTRAVSAFVLDSIRKLQRPYNDHTGPAPYFSASGSLTGSTALQELPRPHTLDSGV